MPPASRYIRFSSQTAELPDPQSFAIDLARKSSAELGTLPAPGVFTTLRTHLEQSQSAKSAASHVLFGFDLHIERLLADARALGFLQPTLNMHQPRWLLQETRVLLQSFIEDFKLQSTPVRARLVLRPELSLEVYFDSYQPVWSPLRAVRVVTVRDEREFPLQKTTLLGCSQRARRLAAIQGADEALLLSKSGFVREGAWSNIFWFDRHNQLHTTGESILPGVTRQVILAGQSCKVTEVRIEAMIEEAVEIFISQSTSGISPVGMIDGQLIHSGVPGPRTMQLQRWYDAQVFASGSRLAYVH